VPARATITGTGFEAVFNLKEKIILAIDCGTQSLRALLFSPAGDLLARAQEHYAPYVSLQPGWAEQDPEVYWASLCRACARLRQTHGDLFTRIAGVGVTTQRNSMVNVNREGACLRPAILWLDQRKAEPTFAAGGLLNKGLRLFRMDGFVAGIQSEGKCNWLMQHQPRIWEATFKYLQISGFLNYRLTGRFADSTAAQIGHLPFNYKKMRWARSLELSARLFPVDRDRLPELVRPGAVIAPVSPRAAAQTAIAAGVPVFACGSDKGCETLGSGIIDQKTASLSFGTTATVQSTSPKYFEPIRFMPAYPAPLPGHYNPEVEIFRGYWMITWYKNEFAYQEVLEARDKGLAAEEILDRLLTQTPPGAMGLMVQPYWGPGLTLPKAKGAMIGFGDIHTRAHVYRAVIEGLGFALYDGLAKIERAGGVRVEKAAVSGGASQSDEICNITANIFNLPMVKGRTHETSGLGAAIVTAVGLKLYASFEEAVRQMVHVQKIFEPDPLHVALYRKLYARVYRKIYKALGPLYAEIKEITGYPE
jgi:sugar (pentulose or hexulose) kinase